MAKGKTQQAGEKAEAPKCPVTKADFLTKAKPILVVVNGEQRVATVKEFATGSFGYFMNEKVTVMIEDIPVKVQANVLLTVIGSKDAK
jgi:hypothetical protein